MTAEPGRPVVLVYDPIVEVPWDYDAEHAYLDSRGVELRIPSGRRASAQDLADADVLIVSEPLPVEDMDRLSRCVGILCYRVGMDNVDLEAAAARGLPVTNLAGYCTDEVSDHALTLMLAWQRRLVPFATEAAAGNWDVYDRPELFQIRRLRGQTLGIVGVGRIGSLVARKASAFGMDVVGHDPFLTEAPPGVSRLVDLETLLRSSDIVVLCSALTGASAHMVGAHELSLMRPGGLLVNVARGGLVDEGALYRALVDGVLAGAALDVRATEPPDAGSDLLRGLPQVLQTQHLAATSQESHRDLHELAGRRSIELLVAAGRLESETDHD